MVIRCVMRRAWTHKFQSSGPIYCLFLYCDFVTVSNSTVSNSLLTSFARSVRESVALGFYRTDLAPSSFGLYEKPQAILSRTDLALG